jgi:ATP-dependent DNA helicase RecQ
LQLTLDAAGRDRFEALRAWRSEVARAHGLPAYLIFHDATLQALAQACPTSLDDLAQIQGLGARKLQAYGEELIRVLRSTG